LSSTLVPVLIELLQTNTPSGVELTVKQVIVGGLKIWTVLRSCNLLEFPIIA